MKIPRQFQNQIPFHICMEDLPDKYKKLFYFDGGISNFGMPRTQWLDNEEREKVITPRGKAQNLLCIDCGSTDLFFSFELINKLQDLVRNPDYYGNISYELGVDGYIQDIWFEPGGKQSIFYWWGELPNRRPTQFHNYVVGCDISKGTGTSNSVAAVEDVNTNEIVGLLITPYLSIPNFAEQVVALCEWIGGNIPPLLIWEENGAPEFLWRVEELGYYNLYCKVDQEGNKLKSKTKHGWRSTKGPTGTKVSILNALESALYEGLRVEPRFTPLKIYDSQTINELGSYVYFEGKVDVGLASMQTETSGAKAAHGDRGIAIALCNEGRKQIEPGIYQAPKTYHSSSWMARKQKREMQIAKQKENSKLWWV